MSNQEIFNSNTTPQPPNCDVLPENFDVFSNILSLLSDDGGELQPIPMSSNMPPAQMGEPSFNHKKTTHVFDEFSPDHPSAQEGTSHNQGTEVSRRRRLRRRIHSKLHASCERKRRDRLRENLTTLRGLLPNTSSKIDQATLLDVAALYIKSLQSQLQLLLLSTARMLLPRESIPGFGGQGIGLNPGMGFHVPYIPFQFQHMAAPVAACVFPSVLIPTLDSTLISNPVPGESTAQRTAPYSFLNPHPGITQAQHGVWQPGASEMLLRSMSGSMTSTGVGPGLGGQGTPFTNGFYTFPACLSNLSTMPPSEKNLPPAF